MNQRRLSSRFMFGIGLLFLVITAALWWSLWNYHQRRVDDVLRTWTELESQITAGAARSAQSWLDGRVGDDAAEQQVLDLYIRPIKPLASGHTWVLRDGIAWFNESADFPQEYIGLDLTEIFSRQSALGARDYTALVQSVMNGSSGSSSYVWAAGAEREFAAWTTVQIGGELWTIGVSVPENEVLSFAAEKEAYQSNFVLTGLINLLLLVIYILMWRQYRQDAREVQLLESAVAQRTHELVRSESRYRTLVENLREGILLFDPVNEQTVYANPAVADIFGKLRKDGITQPLELNKLFLPEDSSRLLTTLKRQLVDPTPSTGIFQARTITGAPLWLEVRTTRMDFEDRPVNMLLINNFTERRRAENALRESEERYRGIFNGVRDAILLEDFTGRIIDVNSGACEMFGCSREEMLTKTVMDICAPGSYIVQVAQPADLPAALPSQAVESTYIRANGELFPVEISMRAQALNGTTVALVVVRDITKRKHAEDALQNAHRKIDQLMSSVPDSLWSGEIDEQGHLHATYISPVIERITGYPARWFIESPTRWLEIVHPDDRNILRIETERFYSGAHSNYEQEYRIVRPDGSIRNLRDRQYIRPLRDRKQIDGVMMDITEQKRVEQKLKKANSDLSMTVKELQTRHREVTLQNEMGDLLQSCLTVEDAHAVIARFAAQLFPGFSGALYLFNSPNRPADCASVWGDKPPARAMLGMQDCWGLRRNRIHVFSEPGAGLGLRCQHVIRPNNPAYICAPLAAQGENLGMLHLLHDRHPIPERYVQLAETTARQLALAVMNLRLRETLHQQATQDSLTGLFNRRYMESVLEEILTGKRDVKSLGIILMDIDQFKRCNDTLGHEAGDILLQSFGQYLRSQFNHNSIACRYGGDEFVVLLPDQALSDTTRQAEMLRAGFRQLQVLYQGEPLHFNSLSLGVAAFPMHGETEMELMRRADTALYEAKSAGGDQVAVAHS